MSKKYISALKTTLCLFFISHICLAEIDKKRYITIDEITPGMDAVCLTVYKGVEIEKFPLKVIDVIRNFEPGRNAILVIGTDERFIHTGPVAGCSGSPVYIDGRLAGATAFGWSFAKDPLYGVTPIAEMLEAGKSNNSTLKTQNQELSVIPSADFSKPISLKDSYNKLLNFRCQSTQAGGLTYLPCPLATTLPQSSFSAFTGGLESFGLMSATGGSAGSTGTGLEKYSNLQMQPGGIISVPLVYGDIELAAIGTITEVVGDKVYGFGHSFLGQGDLDVPMATGYVHTVVANVVRSFKLGQTIDIKGALYADKSAAIVGTIGRKAKTIPMKITVERFNDRPRRYNCQIVSHRYFTPLLTAISIEGAAKMLGDLPIDHSVYYKTRIGVAGYDAISMENFSTTQDLEACLSDTIGGLTAIMNNPYDRCDITSLDVELKVLDKTAVSHIWSLDVSDATVKPGQTITITTVLESYLTGHKSYKQTITIPKNIRPGNYRLIAGGVNDYIDFAINSAPYKYTPQNLPSLISIVNEVGNIQRNNLYMVLTLPPGGIALENAELPELPLSKAMLLNSDKRSMPTMPAVKWLEEKIPVDSIVIDSRMLEITVEN
ncbi:MAG: hypothetical protein WC765_09925 [Phycisphaerae bacterium]|jgi:hypothetical protein